MGRVHHDVPVPALALRRAEAAAALGVSVETFDEHVRPHLRPNRIGSVTTYSVRELMRWLDEHADLAECERRPRHRRAA